MSSPKKSSESLQDFLNHQESGGDLKTLEISTKSLKNDLTENAMLRSRIEEQGQLICYLKQRADNQLKRLNTLEEVNNELHLLRNHAQEESRERFRTCKMLERRFQELSENHEEMIKIKDEYKGRCQILTSENKSLKDQIKRNFSVCQRHNHVETRKDKVDASTLTDIESEVTKLEKRVREILKREEKTINERNKTIENLNRKLAVSEEKLKHTDRQNATLRDEIDRLTSNDKDRVTRFEKEVESLKKKNEILTTELKSIKQRQKQQTSRENETLANLRSEKERLISEVMERGKLVQERQSEVDELKKEMARRDSKMKSLIEDFNQKKDLVNSNLKVQNLKAEKEKLEEDLAELSRNFEAFRLHSQSLLDQEKDLNCKLRNNMLIR